MTNLAPAVDAPLQRQGTQPHAPFLKRLDEIAKHTTKQLEAYLGTRSLSGEISRPKRLLDAMRYAALGNGKRFRPLLVVESAVLFGIPQDQAVPVAAAVECIHCYSLIHDDLPAMDDDDVRRGRPTVHKKFDEATAILAGDALLTLAFDILSRPDGGSGSTARLTLVAGLARAAGIGGMVGGQMLDLAAEGRFEATQPQAGRKGIAALQAMKTGALIRFSAYAGAILAGADEKGRAALDRYGSAVGQAYQIADDLLDCEGDAGVVGKATHKDQQSGKATMVQMLGSARAHALLDDLVREAADALAPFGQRADTLVAAAKFVAARKM